MKQNVVKILTEPLYQPPSGGCVLKLFDDGTANPFSLPAAFRRLCVETIRP